MKARTLSNGITLALGRYQGKSTGIDLCLGFGSAFENAKQAGIAHFLEHMFFSGSRLGRRKPFEMVEGNGGELNAFTSKEETHYYSRIQDRAFSVPVKVMAECFNSGFFKEGGVEIEKKIILNEIREARDNPVKRLLDEFIEICLRPPFNRRTIGCEKTVNSITQRKLKRCIRRNYSSRNCIIGVATSLKEKRVVDEIEAGFSLRRGRRNVHRKRAARPRHVERESRAKIEQAHCCIGFPVMNAQHRDFSAIEVIEEYLGGGLSSRLVQEIREKRGLSYAVNSYLNSESAHGVFAVYFSSKPGRVAKVKGIVLKEFELLQRKGIGSRALARAKRKLIGSKTLELENSFNSARCLVEAHLYGRGTREEEERKIRALKAEDIRRVSRAFLQPEEFAFASLLPLEKKG